MARTPKNGLDFVGWNTDIFENDTKIDELLDAQGWIGFSIYFYLCMKAYASDGYYYRWSYSNAATTARRMGGGISSDTVINTVKVCLRVGLFDKDLLDVGILTSKGIQRRYLKAIQKRSYKVVNHSIWLLDEAETNGSGIIFEKDEIHGALDNRSDNADFLSEKADFLSVNGNNSKVKKSKEEKSKEKNNISTEPQNAPAVLTMPLVDGTEFEIREQDIAEWQDAFPNVDVVQQLKAMKLWLKDNPKKRKTKTGIRRFVTNWLDREQNRGGNRQTQTTYEHPKQTAPPPDATKRQRAPDFMPEWAD